MQTPQRGNRSFRPRPKAEGGMHPASRNQPPAAQGKTAAKPPANPTIVLAM